MKKKILFYITLCGLFCAMFFGTAIATNNSSVTKAPFKVFSVDYSGSSPKYFLEIRAKDTVPMNIDDYDACFFYYVKQGDSTYNKNGKLVAHLDSDLCFPLTALLAHQQSIQYSGEIIGYQARADDKTLSKKNKQPAVGALFLKKKQ